MIKTPCARCGQECAAADDAEFRAYVHGILARYCTANQMSELPERKPLCLPCYKAFQTYTAEQTREPLREAAALDAVERYEAWCDLYAKNPSGTEKPADPRGFFNPRTLALYSHRISNAERRSRASGRGASL